MTFKHQTKCYRNRKGIRYECEEDICDATFVPLHRQASIVVDVWRKSGRRAFSERHPDGFYRVFVEAQREAA